MKISETYTWEAEKADGTIITEGADLTDCVRFSLKPSNGNFPAHDVVNVPMVRRFNRGFNKVRFNNQEEVPGMLVWEDGSAIVKTPQDLMDVVKFGDKIRQKGPIEMVPWHTVLVISASEILTDRPFKGISAKCPSWKMTPSPTFEYLYCVVCKGFRFYVRASDGAALITPEEFELYL
jgi:hypothetical protein